MLEGALPLLPSIRRTLYIHAQTSLFQRNKAVEIDVVRFAAQSRPPVHTFETDLGEVALGLDRRFPFDAPYQIGAWSFRRLVRCAIGPRDNPGKSLVASVKDKCSSRGPKRGANLIQAERIPCLRASFSGILSLTPTSRNSPSRCRTAADRHATYFFGDRTGRSTENIASPRFYFPGQNMAGYDSGHLPCNPFAVSPQPSQRKAMPAYSERMRFPPRIACYAALLLVACAVSPGKAIALSSGWTMPGSGMSDAEQAEILKEHNRARARVGVGPLSWNARIADMARSHAETLAHTCLLAHSGVRGYGENLFVGTAGFHTPADGVRSWLDEARDYDYRANSGHGRTANSSSMTPPLTIASRKRQMVVASGALSLFSRPTKRRKVARSSTMSSASSSNMP